MAVISREELLEQIKGRVGEAADDETLAYLENVTDTLSDYERRLSESGDWERRYRENDDMWRAKYRDRFFGGSTDSEETEVTVEINGGPEPPRDLEDEKVTYESLFVKEG